MKTKYVLHGGFQAGVKAENDKFFAEVLKNTKDNMNVLIVYFATDNGDKYFPEDIEQFEKNGVGKKLYFKKADRNILTEQLLWADIVYLHGGNSLKMLEAMSGFSGLRILLAGKVVAADSAGANLLSKYFYSKRNGVCEGFGVLPIKFVPHFEEENRNRLDEVANDFKTLYLKEYEYEVLEID